MRIRLVYIRHGISCNNWVKYRKPFYEQWKRLRKDPPLTQLAETLCTKQSQRIDFTQHIDLFLCSPTLRTQQTATLLFPQAHIKVAPYTREIHMGASNHPSTLHHQRKYLSPHQQSQLDLQYVTHADQSFNVAAHTSSHTRFLVWLARHWMELVDPSRLETIQKRQQMTIVLVGHSGYIRTILPPNTLAEHSADSLGVYGLDYRMSTARGVEPAPKNFFRLLRMGTNMDYLRNYPHEAAAANC